MQRVHLLICCTLQVLVLGQASAVRSEGYDVKLKEKTEGNKYLKDLLQAPTFAMIAGMSLGNIEKYTPYLMSLSPFCLKCHRLVSCSHS